MKNYPQIISKVYEQPWLILPAKHRAIQMLLEKRMASPDMPMPEAPDEEDPEEMMQDGSTAIIPVHGIIGQHLSMLEMMCGGVDVGDVCDRMDEALMDDSVSRIMFDFQSPGGTVGGIPELGRKIANSAKPTIGWTDSQCCSGAYWLASQCERFYTSESCDVGSIGVYMALLDESRALENEGIKINAISAGKFKLAGAPFKPLTDEERKMFQAGVDKIYTQFKEAVSRNRSLPDSVMQGQVYDGQEAADLGLSDGMLENIQEALDA